MRKNPNRTEAAKRLALSGILIAMAIILSFIKVFEWPFGGSITACSMLPIAIAGYMYGAKWGFTVGVVDGVLQAILGATMSSAFAGQSAGAAAAIILLDYLLAFGVLGFSGMFKGKIFNHTAAFALGTFVAVFLRFVCHVVSGWIFFGSYAEWFFSEAFVNDFGTMLLNTLPPQKLALVYSLIYNAFYMVPEMFITAIPAALIISLVPPIKKEMTK